jgi:N-methylhydantoinase B
LSGFGNAVAIHRFGLDEQRFDSGKAFNYVLHSGDAYILRSGGAGGYGSPLERDLTTLQNDVRQGYVTKEAAEKNYGAVFRSGGLLLDIPATEKRRAEMRKAGLPADEQIETLDTPAALPAGHDHAHHGHSHDNLTDEERLVVAMSGRCCS